MPYEGDNMTGLRRNNRSACLYTLHRQGSMSRKRLAEMLKLTPAAMSIITGELIGEGLLREGPAVAEGRAGRREILLELVPGSRWALGVLIHVGQALLSAVRLDGTVIFSEEITLPPSADAEKTVRALSDRLLQLCEIYRLERSDSVGLGVAIRGLTSPDGRSVRDSFGALDRPNFEICKKFEEHTGLHTVLANNVRALFAAQLFLARNEEVTSQFFLRCEYGIGASFAIGGQIWRGDSGQCAEIGHIPAVRRGGKPCSCGKTGCLETVASPVAICEDARAILSPDRTPILWTRSAGRGESVTVEDVLDAAQSGDAGAATVVEQAVQALAAALRSVIYVLDPGKIVLYGRMFDHPYYLSHLLAEVREGLDGGHNVPLERSIYNHMLEDKAAGLLAVTDFFDRGGVL